GGWKTPQVEMLADAIAAGPWPIGQSGGVDDSPLEIARVDARFAERLVAVDLAQQGVHEQTRKQRQVGVRLTDAERGHVNETRDALPGHRRDDQRQALLD